MQATLSNMRQKFTSNGLNRNAWS